MVNYESKEHEDGVFEISFYDNRINVGTLSYYIEDNVAHLLFINGKGYGVYMLYILLTKYIKPKNVNIFKLDDVSDLSDTFPPSITRSGATYQYTSIYTKIGCQTENEDWDYGPERVCDVDTAINKLEETLKRRKYKQFNFPK